MAPNYTFISTFCLPLLFETFCLRPLLISILFVSLWPSSWAFLFNHSEARGLSGTFPVGRFMLKNNIPGHILFSGQCRTCASMPHICVFGLVLVNVSTTRQTTPTTSTGQPSSGLNSNNEWSVKNNSLFPEIFTEVPVQNLYAIFFKS